MPKQACHELLRGMTWLFSAAVWEQITTGHHYSDVIIMPAWMIALHFASISCVYCCNQLLPKDWKCTGGFREQIYSTPCSWCSYREDFFELKCHGYVWVTPALNGSSSAGFLWKNFPSDHDFRRWSDFSDCPCEKESCVIFNCKCRCVYMCAYLSRVKSK